VRVLREASKNERKAEGERIQRSAEREGMRCEVKREQTGDTNTSLINLHYMKNGVLGKQEKVREKGGFKPRGLGLHCRAKERGIDGREAVNQISQNPSHI